MQSPHAPAENREQPVPREGMSGRGDGAPAPSEIGAIIREHRKRRRLTLQQLAECVGCTRSYLSTIETGRRSHPPSRDVLMRLESALGIKAGELQRRGMWAAAPKELRDEVRALEQQNKAAAMLLERLGAGDIAATAPEDHALARLVRAAGLKRASELPQPGDRHPSQISGAGPQSEASPAAMRDPGRSAAGEQHNPKETALPTTEAQRRLDTEPVLIGGFGRLPVQVPVINKVSAGYPTEFTDLGFPARVADEYIAVPGVHDADAFAARVCGDSMAPEYREGDVVVFSPMLDAVHGSDCFVRFSDDAQADDGGGPGGSDGAGAGETTFKRVYFELGSGGEQLIRLQPLNSAYAPRVVRREAVGGLFRAVSVVRPIPAEGGGI